MRAWQALRDLEDFPMARYPHDVFLGRAWELRSNFSASDAVDVALTEGLDAVLLTTDGRMASAPGHSAKVEGV